MCHTRAEQRGRITSFDVLAPLCLMHSRKLMSVFAMMAHCWLVFMMVPFRTPRFISTKLLCSRLVLSLYCYMRLIFLMQLFPLVNLSFVSDYFRLSPACQVLLTESTTIWFISHFSQLCIIYKLAEG